MSDTMKFLVWVFSLAVFLNGMAFAAQKESSNAKIVNKLQAMVKDITSERDVLKTENAKIATELETLKSQIKQSEQDKETAKAAQDKLTQDLNAQKSTTDEVQKRLDNITAKLREVVEKYNALNKSKNDLEAVHASLKNTQQITASELKSCETKNEKMLEGAKGLIGSYQQCQKRGIIDTLFDSEPFSQIKAVEFETLAQEYEDKLRKQKYQNKQPVLTAPTTNNDNPVTQAPSTNKAIPANTVSPEKK